MPLNRHTQTPPLLSVVMQRTIGVANREPQTADPQLRRWIGELGNNLMWIGLVCDGGELRCLPNHDCNQSEMRGWVELPKLLPLISRLVDCGCDAVGSNVILRTTETLYIVLCPGKKPRLILGVEPSVTLAELGFA